MIINVSNKHIVCDMGGCKNKAKYFVKNKEGQTEYYSLKLCPECAKKLSAELTKTLKKEKSVEKN